MLEPDAVEARSTLATFLRPSAFPASVDELVATAADEGAPPEVVELLRGLPARTYETVNDVWVTLGGRTEDRPEAMEAEPEPESRTAPARGAETCAARVVAATGALVRNIVRLPVELGSRALRLLRVSR